MSMQAVAIMLKAMGLNIDPIAEKVNELVADGTIDRAAALLKTMSQNGTFEQLVALSAKLEEHNRLLKDISDASRTVISERQAELDTSSERFGSVESIAVNGVGMSETVGPN